MSRFLTLSGAVAALFLTLSLSPAARKPSADTSAPAIGEETPDRDDVLNIQRRHIQERDYRVSASASLPDKTRKLNVHVGGGLTASRINLVMVNVHGRVRFQGSLKRISDVLNHHQTSPLPTPTSPGPTQDSNLTAPETDSPLNKPIGGHTP